MDRCKKMKKEVIVTDKDLPPDVIRAVQQGRKIEAIKLLRDATGLGLANAKVLVDKAARQHGPGNPMPGFVHEQTNLRTLLKTLFFVVLAFAVYRYYLAA